MPMLVLHNDMICLLQKYVLLTMITVSVCHYNCMQVERPNIRMGFISKCEMKVIVEQSGAHQTRRDSSMMGDNHWGNTLILNRDGHEQTASNISVSGGTSCGLALSAIT